VKRGGQLKGCANKTDKVEGFFLSGRSLERLALSIPATGSAALFSWIHDIT